MKCATATTMEYMEPLQRIGQWLGLTPALTRSEGTMPATLLPERTVWEPMTERRAMAVPAVFRGLQVMTTAVGQLSVDVFRGGRLATGPVPTMIRKPAQDISRSDWLGQIVTSLITDGNAFIREIKVNGEVLDLPVLPASEVHVTRDKGRITYWHLGTEYGAGEIHHLSLLKPPGWLRGMGPIEAARRGLSFAAGASDYAAHWFDGAGQPTGVLSSDQTLTGSTAKDARNAWNGLDENGDRIEQTANPSGIKVLGKGLTYSPVLLKPADVLWLEAQEFTTVDIARLLGMPTSLMLVNLSGASMTYANVSQEWLGFVRFTVMGYLRPIEEMLTAISPHGQTVRFNLEGLLRGDTLTRYQAHQLALDPDKGWMTPDEIRAIEGLPPLEDGAGTTRPTSTPSLKVSN